jgi:hypothetical protein
MTIPSERTRALVQTKAFLEALQDPKQTPRTPSRTRYWAKTLLRHYPELYQIDRMHEAVPYLFGPVDGTKDGEP